MIYKRLELYKIYNHYFPDAIMGTTIAQFLEWVIRYFFISKEGKNFIRMTAKFRSTGNHLLPLKYELVLHALAYTLILIWILPWHFMTIPTAIGAGVSFAIFATVHRFVEIR